MNNLARGSKPGHKKRDPNKLTLWGLHIQSRRLELNLSDAALAKKAGIGLNTLVRMYDPTRETSVQKLIYVAQALNIPVTYLLRDEDALD